MSRRTWILIACVVAMVIVAEVAFQLGQKPRSRVRIINDGMSPIEDLVVTYAGSRVSLGDVPPGGTALAHLSGSAKGTLALTFTQKGNPMAGCQVDDYDPRSLREYALEQVLEIKGDQVTRYMDDAVSTTPLSRLRDRLWDWVASELDPSRL